MVGLRRRLARRAACERGQVFPLLAVGLLVVLLGIAALVVDYGRRETVKSQLQAAVDAAALAAAQRLPDAAAATTAATDYGAQERNAPVGAIPGSVQQSAPHTFCTSSPGESCTSPDSVSVTASADVGTLFGKVLGVDKMHVQASAAACGPCQSQPLDIMILLDRTLSMCMSDSGVINGKIDETGTLYDCPDKDNAVAGIRTFLGYLNPSLDKVGLAVTPPDYNSTRCATTSNDVNWYELDGIYPASTDGNYVLVNPTSNFDQVRDALDCVAVGGSTAYALALSKANTALQATDSDPKRKKVLIFMSDGAANSAQASVYPPAPSHPADANWPYESYHGAWASSLAQPCHSAIGVANGIKSKATIYTIGYGVVTSGSYASKDNRCLRAPEDPPPLGSVNLYNPPKDWYSVDESPYITSDDALREIASTDKDGNPLYIPTGPQADLSTVYTQLAQMITHARLIPVPQT